MMHKINNDYTLRVNTFTSLYVRKYQITLLHCIALHWFGQETHLNSVRSVCDKIRYMQLETSTAVKMPVLVLLVVSYNAEWASRYERFVES
jgi:hypothetical protein